uniref:Uncharacterized protein n=1 Tax=Knipowitschia caucasica TaxID=637954 RepID=A0AAV2J1Y9_KNICA
MSTRCSLHSRTPPQLLPIHSPSQTPPASGLLDTLPPLLQHLASYLSPSSESLRFFIIQSPSHPSSFQSDPSSDLASHPPHMLSAPLSPPFLLPNSPPSSISLTSLHSSPIPFSPLLPLTSSVPSNFFFHLPSLLSLSKPSSPSPPASHSPVSPPLSTHPIRLPPYSLPPATSPDSPHPPPPPQSSLCFISPLHLHPLLTPRLSISTTTSHYLLPPLPHHALSHLSSSPSNPLSSSNSSSLIPPLPLHLLDHPISPPPIISVSLLFDASTPPHPPPLILPLFQSFSTFYSSLLPSPLSLLPSITSIPTSSAPQSSTRSTTSLQVRHHSPAPLPTSPPPLLLPSPLPPSLSTSSFSTLAPTSYRPSSSVSSPPLLSFSPHPSAFSHHLLPESILTSRRLYLLSSPPFFVILFLTISSSLSLPSPRLLTATSPHISITPPPQPNTTPPTPPYPSTVPPTHTSNITQNPTLFSPTYITHSQTPHLLTPPSLLSQLPHPRIRTTPHHPHTLRVPSQLKLSYPDSPNTHRPHHHTTPHHFHYPHPPTQRLNLTSPPKPSAHPHLLTGLAPSVYSPPTPMSSPPRHPYTHSELPFLIPHRPSLLLHVLSFVSTALTLPSPPLTHPCSSLTRRPSSPLLQTTPTAHLSDPLCSRTHILYSNPYLITSTPLFALSPSLVFPSSPSSSPLSPSLPRPPVISIDHLPTSPLPTSSSLPLLYLVAPPAHFSSSNISILPLLPSPLLQSPDLLPSTSNPPSTPPHSLPNLSTIPSHHSPSPTTHSLLASSPRQSPSTPSIASHPPPISPLSPLVLPGSTSSLSRASPSALANPIQPNLASSPPDSLLPSSLSLFPHACFPPSLSPLFRRRPTSPLSTPPLSHSFSPHALPPSSHSSLPIPLPNQTQLLHSRSPSLPPLSPTMLIPTPICLLQVSLLSPRTLSYFLLHTSTHSILRLSLLPFFFHHPLTLVSSSTSQGNRFYSAAAIPHLLLLVTSSGFHLLIPLDVRPSLAHSPSPAPPLPFLPTSSSSLIISPSPSSPGTPSSSFSPLPPSSPFHLTLLPTPSGLRPRSSDSSSSPTHPISLTVTATSSSPPHPLDPALSPSRPSSPTLLILLSLSLSSISRSSTLPALPPHSPFVLQTPLLLLSFFLPLSPLIFFSPSILSPAFTSPPISSSSLVSISFPSSLHTLPSSHVNPSSRSPSRAYLTSLIVPESSHHFGTIPPRGSPFSQHHLLSHLPLISLYHSPFPPPTPSSSSSFTPFSLLNSSERSRIPSLLSSHPLGLFLLLSLSPTVALSYLYHSLYRASSILPPNPQSLPSSPVFYCLIHPSSSSPPPPTHQPDSLPLTLASSRSSPHLGSSSYNSSFPPLCSPSPNITSPPWLKSLCRSPTSRSILPPHHTSRYIPIFHSYPTPIFPSSALRDSHLSHTRLPRGGCCLSLPLTTSHHRNPHSRTSLSPLPPSSPPVPPPSPVSPPSPSHLTQPLSYSFTTASSVHSILSPPPPLPLFYLTRSSTSLSSVPYHHHANPLCLLLRSSLTLVTPHSSDPPGRLARLPPSLLSPILIALSSINISSPASHLCLSSCRNGALHPSFNSFSFTHSSSLRQAHLCSPSPPSPRPNRRPHHSLPSLHLCLVPHPCYLFVLLPLSPLAPLLTPLPPGRLSPPFPRANPPSPSSISHPRARIHSSHDPHPLPTSPHPSPLSHSFLSGSLSSPVSLSPIVLSPLSPSLPTSLIPLSAARLLYSPSPSLSSVALLPSLSSPDPPLPLLPILPISPFSALHPPPFNPSLGSPDSSVLSSKIVSSSSPYPATTSFPAPLPSFASTPPIPSSSPTRIFIVLLPSRTRILISSLVFPPHLPPPTLLASPEPPFPPLLPSLNRSTSLKLISLISPPVTPLAVAPYTSLLPFLRPHYPSIIIVLRFLSATLSRRPSISSSKSSTTPLPHYFPPPPASALATSFSRRGLPHINPLLLRISRPLRSSSPHSDSISPNLNHPTTTPHSRLSSSPPSLSHRFYPPPLPSFSQTPPESRLHSIPPPFWTPPFLAISLSLHTNSQRSSPPSTASHHPTTSFYSSTPSNPIVLGPLTDILAVILSTPFFTISLPLRPQSSSAMLSLLPYLPRLFFPLSIHSINRRGISFLSRTPSNSLIDPSESSSLSPPVSVHSPTLPPPPTQSLRRLLSRRHTPPICQSPRLDPYPTPDPLFSIQLIILIFAPSSPVSITIIHSHHALTSSSWSSPEHIPFSGPSPIFSSLPLSISALNYFIQSPRFSSLNLPLSPFLITFSRSVLSAYIHLIIMSIHSRLPQISTPATLLLSSSSHSDPSSLRSLRTQSCSQVSTVSLFCSDALCFSTSALRLLSLPLDDV